MSAKHAARVKVTILLKEEDYPTLAIEIAKRRRGPSRTTRLAQLAALGLLVEQGRLTFAQAATLEAPSSPVQPRHDEMNSGYQSQLDDEQINDLFGDQLTNV